MTLRHAILLAGSMLCVAVPSVADAKAKPKPAQVQNVVTLWSASPQRLAAASLLASRLEMGVVDGYVDGPQQADALRGAIARLSSASPAERVEADKQITSIYADYVATLYRPIDGIIYGENAVRPKAPTRGLLLARLNAAADPVAEVATMVDINAIHAQLRDAVFASYQAGGNSALTESALASVARSRAFPAKGRFVLVDAATAKLWMMEDGKPVDSMKVIVGKPELATPLIASQINFAVYNPYWHVPAHLTVNIAKGYLAGGTGYLKAKGYEVVDAWGDDATVLDPASVDWKGVRDGTTTVLIRQRPGGGNFMGKVKFPFNNGQGIYLHDTPDKALFAKEDRQLSNGCVRLEDAGRLASWLGTARPAEASSPEELVRLPKGTPVFISYLTVQAREGAVVQMADGYSRDVRPGMFTRAALR